MCLKSPQQVPRNFRLVRFQGNLEKALLNVGHADFSVSINRCSDRSSLKMSRTCGPINTPSFNLASLSFRNYFLKYSKPLPRLFTALMQFFINPNLMCSGDTKILSLSNSIRFLTHFSPGTEFSLMGQSLIL